MSRMNVLPKNEDAETRISESEDENSWESSDPDEPSSEAGGKVYFEHACALQDCYSQIEFAKITGNTKLVKTLQDKTECNFFADSLDLIDWISYGNQRALKNTFLNLINPSTKRIEKWDDLPLLETEKLERGFEGYHRTLEVIFRRLREYSGLKDEAIQQEVRRLLVEASLVLEYRKSYKKTTGRKMNTKHRHVIKMWDCMLKFIEDK